MAQVQTSTPVVKSPFGQLPFQVSHGLYGAQLKPLNQLLGFGGGKAFDRLQGQLDSGQASGPLADLIRNIQGFAPSVSEQGLSIGNKIAGAAPQVYNDVKSQIQSALGALPGMQQGANTASDLALGGLKDAYSPIRQSALFQQTANNVLNPLRSSEAARGLESSGAGQAMEQNVLQQLGLGFAQNQLGNEANAQQTYGNALGQQSALSQAGIPLAQAGYGNTAAYQQLLQQGYQAPLASFGALLNMLTGGQANTLNLLQNTQPQVASKSLGASVL